MVTVYFATNRNLIGTKANPKFGSTFNADGPHAVRFGRAEVTGKTLNKVKIEVAREAIETQDDAKRVLGSSEVFKSVMRKMGKHTRDTLVYIHGFGFTFEDAVRRCAALKQKYDTGKDKDINIFLFSWPGDGKMIPFISYHNDRADAEASGKAMARTFLFLRDFLQKMRQEEFCQQRLHLMAHSMGNFALRHGLQGIRSELGNRIPRLFDNIILAAADEDDDAFEDNRKFRKLPALARRVHVYYSPDDRALLISDKTKRNPDRLGSDGPRLIDDLPRKVVLIDCRDVDKAKGDIQVHQYYRLRREVVEDINQVLAGVAPEDVENREYNPATRSYRIEKRYGKGEDTLPDPTEDIEARLEKERKERERDRGR